MKIRRGDRIKVGPIQILVNHIRHADDGEKAEVHVLYFGSDRGSLGSDMSVPLTRLEALIEDLGKDWRIVHSDDWLALHPRDDTNDTY